LADFPERFLAEMFGIAREKYVDFPIDLITDIVSGFMQVPNIWAMVEKTKLKNRMTEFESELTGIKEKIEEKENSKYYKQDIFPLIVQKLSKELEDEKVTVIIDGFEHVVDETLHDIEKLYHFYDVLEELRYSDMLFLVELYKQRKYTFTEDDAVKIYQKNKFIRLGLIVDDINAGGFDNEPIEEDINFTEFGHEFYDLFKLSENT